MTLHVAITCLSLITLSPLHAQPSSDKEGTVQSRSAFGNHSHSDGPMSSSVCKMDLLVQCLLEPLDEWAIILYTLRENIVGITSKHCNTTRHMIRRCVEDQAMRDYGCDQETVLSVSARVTDLLMHKKDSGNLLRSYYVTSYVCSEEGRAVRNRIGDDCLLQEGIGQMTFDAMKYIDDRFMNVQERCSFLSERALLMRDIGDQKCASYESLDAGILMCETIRRAFLEMYPSLFGDGKCDFVCRENQSDHPREHTGGGGRRTTDQDAEHSRSVEVHSAASIYGHTSWLTFFILLIKMTVDVSRG